MVIRGLIAVKLSQLSHNCPSDWDSLKHCQKGILGKLSQLSQLSHFGYCPTLWDSGTVGRYCRYRGHYSCPTPLGQLGRLYSLVNASSPGFTDRQFISNLPNRISFAFKVTDIVR